jgi:lipid-A-disaccharide synthase-like uncharacterized protein
MNLLECLGWLGNACFFSRWLIQWHASERAKASVAPRAFWWVSLVGAVALGTYTLIKGEPILLVGFFVNAAIYSRNLSISRQSDSAHKWSGLQLALIGIVIAVALASVKLLTDKRIEPGDSLWQAVGIAGLTIWNARWAMQWWYSEKRSLSHFPPIFWWLSLVGNTLLLGYAIHLGNPVWIASYLLGPIVQGRNLILNHRRVLAERLEADTKLNADTVTTQAS